MKRKKWELPGEVRRAKEEIDAFLARVLEHLGPEDHAIARAHVETVRHLLDILAGKNLSLERLRGMLFGSASEKTSEVLGGEAPREKEEPKAEGGAEEVEKKRKGHGRHGIAEYAGAPQIHAPHATLHSGDACPCCRDGKVYDTGRPGIEPRIKGQPPLEMTLYRPARLRCNLCGEVFTAELPPEAGTKKYDETAASTIALLKYGTGMPFHRLESLEGSLGVPLPAGTQWEVVEAAARACAPAFGELERQAARGELLHNDDTKMKILGRKKKGDPEAGPEQKKKRKGVLTTGIISKVEGHTIALFFTGERNAGQNLAALLGKRPEDLPIPIQMADGLEANIPKGFATILANCAAHGRRKFVELHPLFPEECRVVLEIFAAVYHNDDLATGMSKDERLAFHQEHSGPLMARLKEWLETQLRDKKVEPNSRLGKAISYLLDRWERLTRFLEVPGAPLDNNAVERLLKVAILHRKNALYYRTARGAQVGDLFMSLIQTTRLAGENPFDYLTALQRNAAAVRQKPAEWLPWTYRATLARLEASRAGGNGPRPDPTTSGTAGLRSTG